MTYRPPWITVDERQRAEIYDKRGNLVGFVWYNPVAEIETMHEVQGYGN